MKLIQWRTCAVLVMAFALAGVCSTASARVVALRIEALNQDDTNEATVATSASPGVAVDDVGFNLGDIGVRISLTGDIANDPLVPSTAVAIVSVSEFTRSDFPLNDNFGLPAGRTTYGTAGVNRLSQNRFAITIAEAAPGLPLVDFVEANFDTAVGIFPDADGFLSGYVQSANGVRTFDLNGGLVEGVHLIDGTPYDGVWTINLTGLVPNATANGILLASAAENRNSTANTRANADGTFTIMTHDNSIDGTDHTPPLENLDHLEDFQFVYVPLNTPDLLAVGRVTEDPMGINVIEIGTNNFTVDRVGDGEWFLSVLGANDSNSTLVITGGGEGLSEDNFVVYEAGNHLGVDGWFVRSLDINPTSAPVLEALHRGNEVFSFVVITSVPEPSAAAIALAGFGFAAIGNRGRRRI